ncbi:MAG: hypothetical protein AAFP81_00940 [Pseudomonadota bacterium]
MTYRPIQQRAMSVIWITLCAYGPIALALAGIVLLFAGGLF